MRGHIAARRGQRFEHGHDLAIPITIAWGALDRMIPPRVRVRDQLPAHARWIELPGCGHVMAWDNPRLVTDTILTATKARA